MTKKELANKLAEMLFSREVQNKGFYNSFAVAIMENGWGETAKILMEFGQSGDGDALSNLGKMIAEDGDNTECCSENVFLYMDFWDSEQQDYTGEMVDLDEWWEHYGSSQDYEAEDLGNFGWLTQRGKGGAA